MKYYDVLQKVMAFVLSGCLLLGLSGCGGQTESKSNENQTQLGENQTTQEPDTVPYREFNAEEFLGGDVVTGEIIYIDKEENETPVLLGNAMLLVYEKGVIERFFNTTKEDGVTWKLVKKCLEDDWFNSEIECVELDYISGVQWNDKNYDYFRMNVSDLDGLNSKFEYDSDWLSGKEIYIIARASTTSNSLTNEAGTQIQYFINQFDDNITPTSNPNSQYPNEVAVNNSGTVVVETDYYTIDIPWEWEEYCSCEQLPGAGEHFLTFTVKDKYLEEHSDNILFELAAIPSPEFFPSYYNNEQYSYICRICKDGAFMLNLMQRIPDDIHVKEQYPDLLATLQEFIPYVVQSIEEKDGYTLSYEPIEIDDGIPYVDTWIEILDTTFEQKSTVTPLGNDRVIVPHFYVNDVDGVTYYENHWVSDPDLFYGVRDGLVVAFIGWADDFPEVRTMLSADFDGIEPKTIIHDQNKYLMWKANNGYVVFEVAHSGRGYLFDMVMYVSFFADKEMCSLLTEN